MHSVLGYLSSAITVGTHRYFRLVLSQFGVKVTFLDASNLKILEEAYQENTKVGLNGFYLCWDYYIMCATIH